MLSQLNEATSFSFHPPSPTETLCANNTQPPFVTTSSSPEEQYCQSVNFSGPYESSYATSTVSSYPMMHSNDSVDSMYPNVTTPLTPAVSPSSALFDMQVSRKFSVDVGPFSFGSGYQDPSPAPLLPQDQSAFRRVSACTNFSLDEECVRTPPPPPPYFYHPTATITEPPVMPSTHPLMTTPSEKPPTIITKSSNSKTSPRSQRDPSSNGPTVQHKHACKYPYCGWSFKRYEHLKRHMLVHTGERPHVCNYPGCGKSFSRSDNFHAHCRTHNKKGTVQNTRRRSKATSTATTTAQSAPATNNTTIEMSQPMTVSAPLYYSAPPTFTTVPDMMMDRTQLPFPDQIQGYPAPSYMSYRNHETSTCEPFFSRPSPFLDQVPSTHSSWDFTNMTAPAAPPPAPQPSCVRRASCPVSGDVNAQQKSHVCPVPQCQRRFKRLEHLKRHMRIHTLERPFACTFPNCHKTFSRSDNLSQHMKTHQRHEDRRKSQQQRSPSPSMNSSIPQHDYSSSTSMAALISSDMS